ncbi:GntR family transcriptional regulator [Achromobacter sp. Root83]|uniref:GntR family transcriptional regulator n=1 Tax=Achromobacter sp. Root83 TaxID=1736602 RepID=UPI000709156B|nr:GntR family transcriptional regulator [Achromobacter sp. Root83]KRC84901.1 GntR family transcriptional regulator [Achromobacter sp. Root83]
MKPRIKASRQDDSGSGGNAEIEEITLSEQVYRLLRRDIMSGAFAPGQSLRLEVLRQRYGSSFSPIREALNRLRSERMVINTTSRGFSIAPLSVEEMWDACETRILIDCDALRRSLAHADDAWEARLVGAYHALTLAVQRAGKASPPAEDLEELLEARHLDFHHALIGACRSRWLLDLSTQLYAQTERYRRPARAGATAYGPERDVDDEHRQLLDAAISRDVDGSVAMLAAHYRKTAQFIERIISQPDSQARHA